MNSETGRPKVIGAALLALIVAAATGGCHAHDETARLDQDVERTPRTMHTPAPLLKRNPINPRYFADPAGRAVYLTGSHTWNNLQDTGRGDPPPAFDWDFYLDFLVEHNHNFIRLWAKKSLRSPDDEVGAVPLPYLRTGPGVAIDGKPRVDLTAFNPAYFERLR